MIEQTVSHYRIIKKLGAGGMGEVYLAEDTRLDRKVAIKFLSSESSNDVNANRRLLREAKSAATLDHPNICAIHEVNEEAGRNFIVMQYVEGETLDSKIKAKPPIDLAEALAIAVQIADAIAEAHSWGIIHRDIKPQNIMITARGQAKVMDFGLAKEVCETGRVETEAETVGLLTAPGVILGTVPYMSPEQVRGEGADARSDIFSFGTLLYEMFSGHQPFSAENAAGTISAILTREPTPLARYATGVPMELERIVRKCLEKNRDRRYQTMRDLFIDLENLRTEYGVARNSDSRGETATVGDLRPRNKFTSRRVMALAGFAVVLVSVALAYALLFRGAPATSQTVRSLAVLPMANLSGDPAQDYFADGMTETLIAGLAKVGALRVISRTSVMQYKGAHKPLPEIARELNVDAIVEGSVQRFGERVQINVQLIHAPTDRHLWTETYDRDLRDIVTLQNEMARAVTQAIQIKLTPQEQMSLTRARPIDPAAYDYFLRGRFHLSRQTKADNKIAIEMFDRAVASDPDFASAWAELAQACVWRFFLFTPDEKQWEEKAFVAVEKALSMDPDLAEAHLARGRLLWTPANHFPHGQVIQEYRRALALNPNLDEARNQLGLVYGHVGLFDEASQELEKAVAINPSNTPARLRVGATLLLQGKYEQALTALRSVPTEVNPTLVGYQIPTALLHLGRKEEAAAILGELLKDYPEDTGGLLTSVQALIAAQTGDENTAEAKIKSAIEKGKGFGHFHHTAYNIACAYSLMNKPEEAIRWLQTAAEEGLPCYPMFDSDPYLDPLRQDSRFVTLMMRLKEQWQYYKTIS